MGKKSLGLRWTENSIGDFTEIYRA